MADTISIPLDMWGQARSHIDRDEGSRIMFTPASDRVEVRIPKRCQTLCNLESIKVIEERCPLGDYRVTKVRHHVETFTVFGAVKTSPFWASKAWDLIQHNPVKLQCMHCYFSGDMPSFMKPRIGLEVRIMLGPDTTDNIKVNFSFGTVITATPARLSNRIAQLEAFLYETKSMAARLSRDMYKLQPYYENVAVKLQAQLEKLEEQVRGMNMLYLLRRVGSVTSADAGIYMLGHDILGVISTHVGLSAMDKDYSTTEVLRRIPWSGK